MSIKIESLIPIEQIRENAESVLEIVDKLGKVILLKDNKPAYIIIKNDEKLTDELERTESKGRMKISSSYKLHEAMQIVLAEQPDNLMHAADLADEIYNRDLYIKKNGDKAQATQIRARSESYREKFEVLPGNKIRLK